MNYREVGLSSGRRFTRSHCVCFIVHFVFCSILVYFLSNGGDRGLQVRVITAAAVRLWCLLGTHDIRAGGRHVGRQKWHREMAYTMSAAPSENGTVGVNVVNELTVDQFLQLGNRVRHITVIVSLPESGHFLGSLDGRTALSTTCCKLYFTFRVKVYYVRNKEWSSSNIISVNH